MVELTPSNEAVKCRLEELRKGLMRVVALASAVQEAAWLLPGGCKETEIVQELAVLLNEAAPASMGDVLWLNHSFETRNPQIESLLKSVA